jgi:hypothetical protein
MSYFKFITIQNYFQQETNADAFKLPCVEFQFFSLALQPQWALAYLHETLRFTSVFFSILDSR